MKEPLFKTLYSKPTKSKDSTLFGSYGSLHSYSRVDTQMSDQVFLNHELQVQDSSYIRITKSNNDFFFTFLLIDLFVIILLLGLYRKQFFHTSLALFSSKYFQQIEQKSFLKHPLSLSLFFIFITNTSLLIYHTITHQKLEIYSDRPLYIVAYIIGGLLAFYLSKILLILISGLVFKLGKPAKIYIQYIFLSSITSGLFLSFFLWLLIYTDNALILPIIAIVWLLFEIIRIFHSSLRILPKTDFNSFHYFIYLCTVEILPLIVLGKIVMSGL